MLNRRMPNGMYGGVRGERKSPLLDLFDSIFPISKSIPLKLQKILKWRIRPAAGTLFLCREMENPAG